VGKIALAVMLSDGGCCGGECGGEACRCNKKDENRKKGEDLEVTTEPWI